MCKRIQANRKTALFPCHLFHKVKNKFTNSLRCASQIDPQLDEDELKDEVDVPVDEPEPSDSKPQPQQDDTDKVEESIELVSVPKLVDPSHPTLPELTKSHENKAKSMGIGRA